MYVEDVVDEALEQAQAILEERLKTAHEEAAKTLLSHIDELKTKVRREVDEARQEVARIRVAKIGSAKLRAKAEKIRAQDELIAEVVKGIYRWVEENRGSKAYEEFFTRLVEEGLRALGIETGILVPAKPDVELAERIAGKMGLKIGGSVESIGGVIVTTPDGLSSYNNTLEARVRRMYREIRKSASKILFR